MSLFRRNVRGKAAIIYTGGRMPVRQTANTTGLTVTGQTGNVVTAAVVKNPVARNPSAR